MPMPDLVAEVRIQHVRHENSCDFCCTIWPCDAIRAVEEVERLLDAVESCFSVGEIRFGTNGLATTVRGKVMDVLIAAGRIDESGAAIRRGEGDDERA